MRILDGKSPHFGVLALQDWGWKGADLEQHSRYSMIGIRLLSRQTGKGDVGTAEEDPEQRSDLGGFMIWPRSTRTTNTAREVFPTMGRPTATTPSGPTTGGPAGEIGPNTRTPSDGPGPAITPSSGGTGAGGIGSNDALTAGYDPSVYDPTSPNYDPTGGPGGYDPTGGSGQGGGGAGGGPAPQGGGGGNQPPPDAGSQISNGNNLIQREDGDVGWNPDTGWEYSENGGGGPQTQGDVPNTDRDQEGIVWNPETGWEYPDGDGSSVGDGDGGPGGGDGPGDGDGPGGGDSKPMVPEPVQNQPHGAPVTAVFPCSGGTPTPDTRFRSLRPAVPEVGGKKVWPAFPRGYLTLTVMGTDEDDQNEYLAAADPRLIAANQGNPAYGSLVCDVSGHNIDTTRQASLQSMMRVIRSPAGELSFRGNTRNSIAWNIGADGQAATLGGLVADHGNRSTWLGAVSVRDGGPFDVSDGCKHRFASSGDGEPISPLHLSSKTFFRNESGENQKDGPLEFGLDYPGPEDFFYPAKVYLGYDDAEEYEWPRDSRIRKDQGVWRWWTRLVIAYGGGPTTGDPPQTPGGEGPDPPQTPGGEGGDPPDGPVTGGGGGGGGGSVGGGDSLPGTVGGGNTNDPNGGGGGGSSGGSRGETGNDQGGDKGGGESTTQDSVSLSRYINPSNSFNLTPHPYARTHTRFAAPEFLAKPVKIRTGLEDIAALARPSSRARTEYHDDNPMTGRLVAYGAQGGTAGGPYLDESAEWERTQEKGESRHIGGTAPGGWVLMPPEVDMSDVDSDFAPDGMSVSETYLTAAPGARLAWGCPDIATGGLKDGVSAKVDGGSLKVYSHDAVGNETLVLTVSNGQIEIEGGTNIVLGTSSGTQIGTGGTELLGFHGASPIAQDTGWSVTGGSTDRALDAGSATLADTTNVLGTLIDTLIAKGIIGA